MSQQSPSTVPGQWIRSSVDRADAERLRRYVQRGRLLQGEDDARLDALWVSGMRAWATVIDPRPLALDDAEAEISLRDRELPLDQVGPEIAAIIDGAGRQLAK